MMTIVKLKVMRMISYLVERGEAVDVDDDEGEDSYDDNVSDDDDKLPR